MSGLRSLPPKPVPAEEPEGASHWARRIAHWESIGAHFEPRRFGDFGNFVWGPAALFSPSEVNDVYASRVEIDLFLLWREAQIKKETP